MGSEAEIPIIDLNAHDAASGLLNAAATFGFVFVKHKGLNLQPGDVDSMFKLSKHLFSSDTSIKAECTINSSSSGKNRGWLPMHAETLDPIKQKKGDFKEAFNIGEFIDGKPQQPLPSTIKDRADEIGDFSGKCHDLCIQILKLFGEAFKIPTAHGGDDWFTSKHDTNKPSGSVLRLLYAGKPCPVARSVLTRLQYPVLPPSLLDNPDEDIRAGAHSDYGSITLLFRLPNQPGLEILTREGTWATVPVNPEPDSDSSTLPILVNIGDLLSFWTNNLLKSTVHRVTVPKPSDGPGGAEDRYSIAYFCHPQDDAQLVEIPSQVVKEYAEKSTQVLNGDPQVLTARDHLNSRLAATYGI